MGILATFRAQLCHSNSQSNLISFVVWLLSNIIMSGIRLLKLFCVAIGPLLVGAVEFLIVFFWFLLVGGDLIFMQGRISWAVRQEISSFSKFP